ncbi:hypothetical protein IFM89_015653, partial [Coptis chinensis]
EARPKSGPTEKAHVLSLTWYKTALKPSLKKKEEMKLDLISNGFKSLTNPILVLPSLSRALFYTTDTCHGTNLFKRIASLGDQRVSAVPVLEQWVQQGTSVIKDQLTSLIRDLKAYRRFKHPLEISQWMSDQRYIPLSTVDVASRLDLISKVHGIEQAEKYFDTISEQIKKFPVYNALLNSYANAKSIEKAEAFVQQMKQLGLAQSTRSYNVLLSLYSNVGLYEKLDTLMEEMKENGVHPDKFTLGIRMSAYVANSDIEGMEKNFQHIEVDPNIIMDWDCYAIAANGYIRVGLIDKALEMLKNSEKSITRIQRKVAYNFLLTLYASARNKEDVRRIWKLYKSLEKLNNKAYICMIGSLLKLDDMAGAEKILEEWESGNNLYDFRIPNLLVVAYCKTGLVEKAEKLMNVTIEKGKKPFISSWDHLATGYVQANQLPKALKAVESAFPARRGRWMPNRDTLSACLEYLKQQGDAVKTEEFVRLLGAPGHMPTDDIERLLDYIYTSNRQAEVSMANEIEKKNEGVGNLGLSLRKPDCHALLKLYFQAGQYEKADNLMDGMKENGICNGHSEKAEGLMSKPIEEGKKPSASTWGLLISGDVILVRKQWMSDQRHIPLAEVDMAGTPSRLDLISKVHGIEQAEKYFDTISKQIKKVRSTMLLAIAMLMPNALRKYEKLDTLMEEMIENGAHADNKFPLSIRMSACAANSDIEGMEKYFQRIEVDPNIIMDWNC